MDGVSDLVNDSKLSVRFYEDHFYNEVFDFDSKKPGGPLRRRKKEQKWIRERRLGRGTFGDVWLYKCDEEVGTKFQAVKVIPRLSHSTKAIDYTRELEAMFKFSHRKYEGLFVESFGWFDNPHSVFVTMEYIELGDLEQHLDQPLKEAEAQQISSQLLEGLEHIHSNGFAHRDLKPANIFVVQKGPHWWVKIGDFGVSKRTREGDSAFQTVAGTPGFWAPEVNMTLGRDDIQYTQMVDIWSLGIMLHYILTGCLPFSQHHQLRKYIQDGQLPTALLNARGVSSECKIFIQKLLVVEPTARLSAKEGLLHSWIQSLSQHSYVSGTELESGAVNEAERVLREAYKKRKAVLGPLHQDTLESLYQIGCGLLRQGTEKKALEPLWEVYHAQEELVGSDGGESVKAVECLTECLQKLGKHSQALKLLLRHYKGLKARQDPYDYPFLTIAHRLAPCLRELKRYGEAASVYREIAEQWRLSGLGFLMFDSMIDGGNCLLAGRLFKEAEVLFTDVYEQEVKEYGVDNLKTSYSAHGLGASFYGQGEMKKAHKMFRKAYECRRKALGDDDALTRESLQRMIEAESGMQKLLNRFSRASKRMALSIV
ncbi:hypothetical protein CNMCM8694_008179 [Aspergillus lentulus]|nr:hypothetical protein CNMCM8060_007264 [Aspergillus lentulus]KAF4183839.1 hypothetical protein CNMCM7927_008709 [Aspergillus lentulus]KAF4198829.1 hypothetical protein CNMCM8694_008179 [Aspergillus lentulus]